MSYQVVQEFIDNPKNAPWYMDQEPWPSNVGCSGQSSYNLRKNREDYEKSRLDLGESSLSLEEE